MEMTIQLVWDRSRPAITIGTIAVYPVPREYPPFSYQALVEEQDTCLLLGEQHTLVETDKPAWYLANTLERDQPVYETGNVIIRSGQPITLQAVVHDIEQYPTCDTQTLLRTWQTIMTIIEQKNVKRLATPVLGSVHGKIVFEEAWELLQKVLLDQAPACLEKIWLIMPNNKQLDAVIVDS